MARTALRTVALNSLWLLLLAIVPTLLAIGASVWGKAAHHPNIVIVGLGVGWSATFVVFALWFQWDRKIRRQRLLDLATTNYVSHVAMLDWINYGDVSSSGLKLADSTIQNILRQICNVVAYHEKTRDKGAAFFVATGREEDAKLEMRAQINHDDPAIAQELTNLTRGNSLAGQAIREGKTIWIKDCSKGGLHNTWYKNHEPPRFKTRAAAPVRARNGNSSDYVGVLCFDVKGAGKLKSEDLQLLQSCADTIGILYALLSQPRANASPTRQTNSQNHRARASRGRR